MIDSNNYITVGSHILKSNIIDILKVILYSYYNLYKYILELLQNKQKFPTF